MQVIKHSQKLLITTLVTMILSLCCIVVFGLQLSNDFTGGAVFRYNITNVENSQDFYIEKINESFKLQGVAIEDVVFEEGSVTVRTGPTVSGVNDAVNGSLFDSGLESVSFETIGSVLGKEMMLNSLSALVMAFVAILFYIAYSFRNIPKPYSNFKFGASALFAMAHDVLFVLGTFAILGKMLNLEIDVMFVTALLTIIGFSVHDTIVVFDRVRENLIKKKKSHDFPELVNDAIRETLRRSIATSFTVLVVLFSLFFFGGDSIKYFTLALIVGIMVGTYSSIFVASPVLVLWELDGIKSINTSKIKKSKK